LAGKKEQIVSHQKKDKFEGELIAPLVLMRVEFTPHAGVAT